MGEKITFTTSPFLNKVCPTPPVQGMQFKEAAPQDPRQCDPPPEKSLGNQGRMAQPRPWLPPRRGSSPTTSDARLQKAPAASCWRTGLFAAGCRGGHLHPLCHCLPTPPSRGKKDEGGQRPLLTLSHPQTSALPSPLTRTENPGPLEELLLLLPSSLSMNTQQHPRSRPSYSGGRRNRSAASGAGSRCSARAGLPGGPRPLPSQREDPKPG